MEIKERGIAGVYEITLSPHIDSRGFFMRTYDNKIFENTGIDREWVQENHSRSNTKGIIRGLHFQLAPFSETKLVRCIRGSVLDVFVDLRKNSPTFGQWDSMELSERNKKTILIPKGLAHGFCTLTKRSEVVYKVDNYYSKDHECGIIWNDRHLNIPWPVSSPELSEKDSKNYTFAEFVKKFNFIDV